VVVAILESDLAQPPPPATVFSFRERSKRFPRALINCFPPFRFEFLGRLPFAVPLPILGSRFPQFATDPLCSPRSARVQDLAKLVEEPPICRLPSSVLPAHVSPTG
jgi:hypothetical protein